MCYRNAVIQDELSTCVSWTPQAECYRKEQSLDMSMTMVQVDTEQRAQDQDQFLSHPILLNSFPEPSHIKGGLFCFLTSCGQMLMSSFPDLNHQMERVL